MWKDGTISAANGDSTYDIDYDDGSTEAGIHYHRLRLRSAAPPNDNSCDSWNLNDSVCDDGPYGMCECGTDLNDCGYRSSFGDCTASPPPPPYNSGYSSGNSGYTYSKKTDEQRVDEVEKVRCPPPTLLRVPPCFPAVPVGLTVPSNHPPLLACPRAQAVLDVFNPAIIIPAIFCALFLYLGSGLALKNVTEPPTLPAALLCLLRCDLPKTKGEFSAHYPPPPSYSRRAAAKWCSSSARSSPSRASSSTRSAPTSSSSPPTSTSRSSKRPSTPPSALTTTSLPSASTTPGPCSPAQASAASSRASAAWAHSSPRSAHRAAACSKCRLGSATAHCPGLLGRTCQAPGCASHSRGAPQPHMLPVIPTSCTKVAHLSAFGHLGAASASTRRKQSKLRCRCRGRPR